ncbi:MULTISPECIES: hypothetical protein [unclassified Hyphomicrobium]|uniref:hypothetical protein n=1 Tax=unclassified Hyphomicrobium TaxID=2619925 RepID=UPI000213F195|nr:MULTISPECIES: hypothetical protein [unclassified Hyphomicrobium]CCB64201.1 conserved exported protein of unknown function [Hyphomicrobium sp. MC1]
MTKQEVRRPLWLSLAAGSTVAFAGLALFFASSESVLRSSFQTALNDRAEIHTKQVRQVASIAPATPVSGSEDFWLSAMRDGTTPVTKTISVGDQISLDLGGVHRTLEVSTVSDFTPQITQIDTSTTPTHLVLVTARDLNDSGARPVRFVMEIQQGGLPVVAGGRSGRTL